MKLFKWNPADLKPKFPNIIEKFFGKRITDDASQGQEIATVPSVNISDASKAFEVNVALPGLDKKDVKVTIQNDCLCISSEKQYDNEEKTKNWIRREYGYASFQRMFNLPESADPAKVQAEMKNGVLTVKIGKRDDYIDSRKVIDIQ
ncbi:MAG: Hsp20/alpha crystallin family protein [Bacteroidales bacterium]|jgi:HSP20 family protein|nr:Hsp20/alpha crystallin family protein [Bacteroidales bacterium]MDY0254035.1 Hsp20/alpha crystallin family protein [Tenuifilaceae bacterium]